MTNHIDNDRGETVIAVGAPGSLRRVEVQYPALIARLNQLYCASVDSPGRRVDLAVEMIREAGVSSPLETNSLLLASLYKQEPEGSVTRLLTIKDETP